MPFVKLTLHPKVRDVEAVYVNMDNVTFMEQWKDCTVLYFNDTGESPLKVLESAETIFDLMGDGKPMDDKPIKRPQPLR